MAELLTRDEEVSLARRIAAGDKAAEDELVTRNLPLVGKISKKFLDRGLDLCDLFQEGSIGLVEAARTFKVEKGTRFSSWAGLLIFQHINRAVKRVRPMRRLSEHEAMMIPARDESALVDEVDETRARRLEVELEILDGDERAVLSLKFGGDRERSNREVARVSGRSRWDVDRINRRAVSKLRAKLNPGGEAA